MRLSPLVRRLLLAVAVLSLLALGWNGLSGGFSQVPESHALGQKAQTACQFAYGLCALLTVATTFGARRWSPISYAGWAVSVTLAAGLAAVAWGGTSTGIGVLSGVATLLIALAIIGLLHVGRPA